VRRFGTLLIVSRHDRSVLMFGYVCPVCGYPGLTEPPRSKASGGGSYEICPSCGFQFGVSDDDRGISYEQWRAQWIQDGTPFTAGNPPENWDPFRQMQENLS
jgi:hypothetical protein